MVINENGSSDEWNPKRQQTTECKVQLKECSNGANYKVSPLQKWMYLCRMRSMFKLCKMVWVQTAVGKLEERGLALLWGVLQIDCRREEAVPKFAGARAKASVALLRWVGVRDVLDDASLPSVDTICDGCPWWRVAGHQWCLGWFSLPTEGPSGQRLRGCRTTPRCNLSVYSWW